MSKEEVNITNVYEEDKTIVSEYGGYLPLIGSVLIVLILILIAVAVMFRAPRFQAPTIDTSGIESDLHILHCEIVGLKKAVDDEGEALGQLKLSMDGQRTSISELKTDMSDWARAQSTINTISLKGVNRLTEQSVLLIGWSQNLTTWLNEFKRMCCYRTGSKVTDLPVAPINNPEPVEKNDASDAVPGTP